METKLFDLTGKIAIVTGGAGQLGREYCKALNGAGAKVVSLDVLPAESERIKKINETYSCDSYLYIAADLLDRSQLEKALDTVKAKWGSPHVLVNNAAIDSPPSSPPEENGPFETYPEASLNKVLSVNINGVTYACQVFGGEMAKCGRGSIINVSSIYGMVSPNQGIYEYRRTRGETFFKPVAYSISKSALFNLTRYLATYWAKNNVRVNTLTLAGVFNNQDPEFLKNYCDRIPIGRMARPDEYNGAVIFLAADASAYMTGSNLVVDGGWTAW